MVVALLSRLVAVLLGTLYPAYASYKAIRQRSNKEYLRWMMFWIVMAIYSIVETLADTLVCWLPFYYEAKVLFILWLVAPATKGSSVIYRKLVHPQLQRRESDIDAAIDQATERGYTTVMALGASAVKNMTGAVLSTAVLGQQRLVEQLKEVASAGGAADAQDGVAYVEGEVDEEGEVQPVRRSKRLQRETQEELKQHADEENEARARKQRATAPRLSAMLFSGGADEGFEELHPTIDLTEQ